MELIVLFLKLILALGVVLGLMFLLYRVSDSKMKQIGNTKYIKVLERTQLSKESSLLLVKLGDDVYVMSSNTNKNEIIKKLEVDEIQAYESSKFQNNYDSIVINYFKKKQKGENNE